MPENSHVSPDIHDGSLGVPRVEAEAEVEVEVVVCFSHLRWDFVTQRPQHLMRRAAAQSRVFFWEEPIPTDHHRAYIELHPFPDDDVVAIRPRLPHDTPAEGRDGLLASLFRQWWQTVQCDRLVGWLYTPLMLPILEDVEPDVVVYDCMDELSAFAHADPRLLELETELLARADVVFTGGHSLFESKRRLHANVHELPSAVDLGHFRAARMTHVGAPADQEGIPEPRVGYYGVIDERLDLELVERVARDAPERAVVMVGPVVKIDPATLPQAPNLYWLGQRSYVDLPAYLAGWDVALMPFALNEATRFISPTKAPEYLAGGVPVVSTAVADVISTYSGVDGVVVAHDHPRFLEAVRRQARRTDGTEWLAQADAFLAERTWDATFEVMRAEIDAALERAPRTLLSFPIPSPDRFDVLAVSAGYPGAGTTVTTVTTGTTGTTCEAGGAGAPGIARRTGGAESSVARS